MLSALRGEGMNGPEPIKVSEIVAYCDLLQIEDVEERIDVLRWVTFIDEHRKADDEEKGNDRSDEQA